MANHGALRQRNDWRTLLYDLPDDTGRAIVQSLLDDTAAHLANTLHAEYARVDFRRDLHHLQQDMFSREALRRNGHDPFFTEWDDLVEPAPQPTQHVECVACTERVHPSRAITAPCDDIYCDDCLERLYRDCMTDETLFPPRCCQKELPWQLVRHHLSQQCRSKFGVKRKELETLDRTYCHILTCSAFIDPNTFDDNTWAVCPRCGWETCPDCKAAAHKGRCRRDRSLDELLATAADNGWQRCYACHQMVELKHGCNRMTCVCKSQFCYLCGEPWKTCNCDEWDEDLLYEHAEDVADLEHASSWETDEQREVRIERLAEHLRAYHDCEHERFKSIGQRGAEFECELCSETYDTWIYQCRQCLMIACNTCRHHRL